MKYLVIATLFLLFSCNSSNVLQLNKILQEENYVSGTSYPALSVYYNNKPISALGLTVTDLRKQGLKIEYLEPKEHFSPNSNLVKKYATVNEDFNILLDNDKLIIGSLNYSAVFYYDEVFKVKGYWNIGTEVTEENKKEIEGIITSKIFPILKDKLTFTKNWSYSRDNSVFTENWSFNAPGEDNVKFWVLSYNVTINPFPNKKQ